MAQVEVRDYALWIKHIHGSDALRRKLEALEPDQTVRLRVDGEAGVWKKMKANKTGRSNVPGLTPIGRSEGPLGPVCIDATNRTVRLVDIELAEGSRPPTLFGYQCRPCVMLGDSG